MFSLRLSRQVATRLGQVLMVAVLPSLVLAAGTTAPSPPLPPPVAPAATAPPISPVTRAAVAAGALTCARRINDLTNYLARGAAIDGEVFADPTAPDQHPLAMSLELADKNQSAYVGATFSPRNNGNCDAIYEAVVWWPESCNEVARKNFAALRPRPPLQKQVLALDGGTALKVFLMPAGAGCVSIKKEMVRQGP